MKAVHFGAGNIGRGFIGEVLFNNQCHIDFVDINETIISALHTINEYDIEIADDSKALVHVENVDGINNQTEPEKVIEAILQADIITTAIGPNILPFIAELIAKGIVARKEANCTQAIDIMACENMIGGSDFLLGEVKKYLTPDDLNYVEKFVAFPNAAVDRIVPIQHHDDPLFVSVEPFFEWVIDESQAKSDIRLEHVTYVEDLEPFIERKLFTVNTGHATVAYTGAYYGYKTIDEAMNDERVLSQLTSVLNETGSLLVGKWGFDSVEHQAYIQKIITRFNNPYLSDSISRVARTPMRKLGYDERFIRPIRELSDREQEAKELIKTAAMIFKYNESEDAESVELMDKVSSEPIETVMTEVTQLTNNQVIMDLKEAYLQL